MNRRISSIVAGFIVIYLLATRAEFSLACHCVLPKAPADELSTHSLVFAGNVTSVNDARGCGAAGERVATFEITEAFLGAQQGDHVDVRFGGPTDCDYNDVRVGQSWLVFTDEDAPVIEKCEPRLRLGVGAEYYTCSEEAGCVELTEDQVLEALRAG